jgi:hypothetical protein
MAQCACGRGVFRVLDETANPPLRVCIVCGCPFGSTQPLKAAGPDIAPEQPSEPAPEPEQPAAPEAGSGA